MGTNSGAMNFGGADLTANGTEPFIARLTSDGDHVWSVGLDGSAVLEDAVVDSVGNVIVGGYLQGNADFGSGALPYGGGATDAVVAKFSVDGSLLWVHAGGDGSNQIVHGVGIATTNRAFASGYFQGSLNLGAQLTSDANNGSVFLSAFDP